MPTQTKSSSACVATSCTSSVNERRSRFRSSSSGEALLVDRHAAGPERLDLLGDDVADHDVVAEVGEAGAGDESDPARAEDPDARPGLRHAGGQLTRGMFGDL